MSEERLRRAREKQLSTYEAMIADYMGKGPEPPNERLFWADMMEAYKEGQAAYQKALEP